MQSVQVGKPNLAPLAPDTADQCRTICQEVGLNMSAVVVMAGRAGCVCGTGNSESSFGTAGGMAAILDDESARERRQNEEREQQRRNEDRRAQERRRGF